MTTPTEDAIRRIRKLEIRADAMARLIQELRPTDDTNETPAKPAAPEWDGEGLPPVGSTQRNCELVGIHGDTGQFEVVAHRNGAAIVYVPLDDNDGDAFPALPCHFRPLRTQAERERDDLADLLLSADDSMPEDRATTVANCILSKYDLVRKGDS